MKEQFLAWKVRNRVRTTMNKRGVVDTNNEKVVSTNHSNSAMDVEDSMEDLRSAGHTQNKQKVSESGMSDQALHFTPRPFSCGSRAPLQPMLGRSGEINLVQAGRMRNSRLYLTLHMGQEEGCQYRQDLGLLTYNKFMAVDILQITMPLDKKSATPEMVMGNAAVVRRGVVTKHNLDGLLRGR